MKKRALISVSDKTGVIDLAIGLERMGFQIVSTGGTFKFLTDVGINAIKVEEITEFPECFDGRVKTLHPMVHGGILFDRTNEEHVKQANSLGIEPFDMVVVNLYPFAKVYNNPKSTHEDKIENIDIGGPSMLRGAAKNYKNVIILTDSEDYGDILSLIEEAKGDVKGITNLRRHQLAVKAFAMTAEYDTLIAKYMMESLDESFDESLGISVDKSAMELPESIGIKLVKAADLRYGENPQQKAAIYSDVNSIVRGINIVEGKKLGGKDCSFNNYLDINSAVAMVSEFDKPGCVAVKHNNPCGAAIGADSHDAYMKAYECDSVSIFGGVVAFNCPVDEMCAGELVKTFLEVVVAPSFTETAVKVLEQKKNLRIMEIDSISEQNIKRLDIKTVFGGYLVQTADAVKETDEDLKLVTTRKPADQELEDVRLALGIVKHVKSNAIVLFKDGQMVGVGGGQTSRIWALENAIDRSTFDLDGAVMVSDGFFPFTDCIELAAKHGIRTIAHPGGSLKDGDSTSKAEELELSLLVTGIRHFKH